MSQATEIGNGDALAILQQARRQLEGAHDELVLDFSAVRRIDSAALRAMDELTSQARERSVTVGLRGVNSEVYKVLKLAKLAARFAFLN